MIQKRLTIDRLGAGGMVIHDVLVGHWPHIDRQFSPATSPPLMSAGQPAASYQRAPEIARLDERQSVPVDRMVNAARPITQILTVVGSTLIERRQIEKRH
jgi:hypothetical protein